MAQTRPYWLSARYALLGAAAFHSLIGLGVTSAAAATLAEPVGSASLEVSGSCDSTWATTTLASVTAIIPGAQAAKSAAILAGQPSALELIRQSQEAALITAPRQDLAVTEAHAIPTLAPAADGVRLEQTGCLQRAAPAFTLDSRYTAPAAPGDYLASRRVRIGHTAFDANWQRVRSEKVSSTRYRNLLGNGSQDKMDILRSVNSWVNSSIRYTEDRDLFGRADYWAGARKTLKLGRGDCEDIALTKMQLLAAAGIPRENMYLTIARDLVRNADHAVLIVRHGDQYLMLDNSSDEVFDASSAHDYRPVLSFNESQAWLHGY